MELIISTRNPSKAIQIRPFFDGLPISVKTLEEAGISGEAVEDGITLGENAEKKARFAWERSRAWSVADDTGLFIDALNGAPGIHAARWAGDGRSTEDIMRFTLDKLARVPQEKRTATFKTAVILIDPNGAASTFLGEAPGVILIEPRVVPQPKMPYSGIFLPNGSTKVWAEMSTEEENAISHRGKAFAQARAYLESKLR